MRLPGPLAFWDGSTVYLWRSLSVNKSTLTYHFASCQIPSGLRHKVTGASLSPERRCTQLSKSGSKSQSEYSLGSNWVPIWSGAVFTCFRSGICIYTFQSFSPLYVHLLLRWMEGYPSHKLACIFPVFIASSFTVLLLIYVLTIMYKKETQVCNMEVSGFVAYWSVSWKWHIVYLNFFLWD